MPRGPWSLAPLAGAILALATAAAGAEGPRRVASMNLCTDVLLHELAAPGQVASVSHMALDPLVSYYRPAMAGLPVNHGHAEELLMLRPDLVLASGYSPSPTTRLLERQGIPVAVVRTPQRLAALPAMYRRTARLLGRPRAGERLARRLERLVADVPPRDSDAPVAVVFQANGLTYGAGTLADDVLRAAGLQNLAALEGMEGAGYLSLEALIAGRPDVVVMGATGAGWPSRGQALLEHPALVRLARRGSGPRVVHLPERFWACPGAYLTEAVARLRTAALAP